LRELAETAKEAIDSLRRENAQLKKRNAESE
jgi:hypothetical protein